MAKMSRNGWLVQYDDHVDIFRQVVSIWQYVT